MDDFKITLAIKPKHGLIYSYMKENGLTIQQLALSIDVGPSWLGEVVNLKYFPKRKNGKAVQKVLDYFGVEFSDIFPTEKLKLIAGERQISRHIPKDKLVSWTQNRFDMLPAPETEQNIDEPSLDDAIEKALNGLRPEEKEIICLRFGINKERKYSLREIGEIFGVTPERIRQREIVALRKLRRHSKRTQNFQGFI